VILKMSYELVHAHQLEEVKVSVIVPMYNIENDIEDALSTLMNQSLKSIECIVIDDGSTDKSLEIIKNDIRKYPNITLLSGEHAGVNVARNKGLEVARGAFVFFMDGDDMLEKDGLEGLYNAAKKYQTDITIGIAKRFNQSGNWHIKSHKKHCVYMPGEKSLSENPELLYALESWNKLFKRELIAEEKFFEEAFAIGEHAFIIKAMLKAKKIYTIDQVVYYQRKRDGAGDHRFSQISHDDIALINQIFKGLKHVDQVWELSQHALKVHYYKRILQEELWPLLKSIIVKKETKIQVAFLESFLDWLTGLDAYLLNELPRLHQILSWEIISLFAYLGKKAKKVYLKCLKVGFSKLTADSLNTLRTSEKSKAVESAWRSYQYNHLFPIHKYLFFKKHPLKTKEHLYKLIVLLCHLIPLSRKITFITIRDDHLTDSFKLIYDELENHRPKYKLLTHFKNRQRTFKEFCLLYYHIGTSKYVILDDYCPPLLDIKLRKKTEVIQTWHAAGAIKKFGNGSIGCRSEFEAKIHQSYTKVVVTSEKWVAPFAEAFHISKHAIYPIGLARTDVFFCEKTMEDISDMYLRKYPQLTGKTVITYAPTFRGRGSARATFSLRLNLKMMKEELDDNYIVVLKLHPIMKEIPIPEALRDFVLDLSSEATHHVLMRTDILITDYSSVAFEYALLERPMIFYAYDHEKYEKEQGFYYDYHEMMPGPIVKTTKQMIQVVQKNKFDIEKIKKFKHEFFDHLDGQATKRFVDTFIEI